MSGEAEIMRDGGLTAAQSRPGRTNRRLRREAATVRVMIELYCRERHGPGPAMCAECEAVWRYAEERLARCPFHAGKPTCLDCTVHCYRPEMRERIRLVMRYAGPRMAWQHPILSLFHLLDGRRKPPAGRARRQT